MYYREIESAVPVAEEDAHQLQETVKSILARVKTDGMDAHRFAAAIRLDNLKD